MASSRFSLEGRRVFVSGHRGMVGSALVRRLQREKCEILTADRSIDLRVQASVEEWFAVNRPEAVFVAAAKVGGIGANQNQPGQFLYDNLAIATNSIEAARKSGVRKLLFLGSSCIYPRDAAQPIVEESLLSGPLEPTNEWYAIAKIAGVKLCQAYRREYGCDFISAMPTNLYGPGDTYDLAQSHVVPALIMKALAAKAQDAERMQVWGSGKALREFLHVDDLADACVFLMNSYSSEEPVNIGSGAEISIAELAALIAEIAGFTGELAFDHAKPDGTPRKLLDCSRLIELGWRPSIALREGLSGTIKDLPDRSRA
ncbi:GDP-L-fucose synthase family protein [Qipengyuania gaetbuli]|uniref:GDP-L-fucose synthase family protein n=1 Tax=Qipengyuania gaetbuli TaxID=266952 RepID=UPI001CD6D52B|nr:GDP-L-fucose synthase [Qipengyuania gaetbuli]MCA0908923.1 GDP-L-fucose synthase [Qipengyuania gaetbuli]